MALSRFLKKSFAVLLKPRTRQVLPSTALKTSSPNHGFFNKYKEEYDEDGNELEWPDEEVLAAGMWKKEIEWRKAGIDDPWTIGSISRGDKGSKLDPIMVPGSFESRTIACHCHPDQNTPFTMWLHQGEPKRCRCGFWMVLYYKEPISDWTIPQ